MPITTIGLASPAQAHNDSSCRLDGNALWSAPNNVGIIEFQGIGKFICDGVQHNSSKGVVLLQSKNNAGNWVTKSSGGGGYQCCNQSTWTIKTGWSQGCAAGSQQDHQHRVRVSYWYLYNDQAVLAHSRSETTVLSWTDNVKCTDW